MLLHDRIDGGEVPAGRKHDTEGGTDDGLGEESYDVGWSELDDFRVEFGGEAGGVGFFGLVGEVGAAICRGSDVVESGRGEEGCVNVASSGNITDLARSG